MAIRHEKIWVDQCEAAEGILERFGFEDAVNYLVGEKFLNFLDAATTRPEFESEVSAVAERVREIFDQQALHAFFSRSAESDMAPDIEDTEPSDVVFAASRIILKERAKELLLG